MKQFDINDKNIDFLEISKILEDKQEDRIIINRDNKPLLVVSLYQDRSSLFGSLKETINIPDRFDDIDISNDFEGEIFPE